MQTMTNIAALDRQLNLIPITGTEKQIAWANTLRAKWIDASFDSAHILMMDKIDYHGLCRLSRYRRQILSQTSAAWWIDNRTTSFLGNLDIRDHHKRLDHLRGDPDSIHIRISDDQDAIDLSTPDGDIYCYRRYDCADLQVHLHITASAPDEDGKAVIVIYPMLGQMQPVCLRKYRLIGYAMPAGIPEDVMDLLEHGVQILVDAADQDSVRRSMAEQIDIAQGLIATLAIL